MPRMVVRQYQSKTYIFYYSFYIYELLMSYNDSIY